jgi:hypothetical protein
MLSFAATFAVTFFLRFYEVTEPRHALLRVRTHVETSTAPLKTLHLVVPEAGIEPAWCCHRQILSLLRLPISPLRPKDESLPLCQMPDA